MLLNGIACYREIIHERKSQSTQQTLLFYFKKLHSHLNLQQLLRWSVSNHQQLGKTLHQQKDYDLLKAQMMVNIFSSKVFEGVYIVFLDIMLLHT